MIDVRKLLEDAEKGSNPNTFGFKEPYSENEPAGAIAFLNEPIDLNNPIKWMRVGTVREEKPVFSKKPKSFAKFAPFEFGPGILLDVDTGKDIEFFSDGSAKVTFVQTDPFFEAVQKFEDAIATLDPDLDKLLSDETSKILSSDPNRKAFDRDSVYGVSTTRSGDKRTLRNQQQAIAKKLSLWQAREAQREKDAKAKAEETVAGPRNKALTDSGISDGVIRLILNGSFEYYGATLRFYPTQLDLVRALDRKVSIPSGLFLRVNANDSESPRPSAEFQRKILKETYASVRDGKTAFDDIRDCRHWDDAARDHRPFPIVRPVRWQAILNRLGPKVKTVDLLSFPRLTQRTFGQNGLTWDGETGRVFTKLECEMPSGKKSFVVITLDGLLIVYENPATALPTTVYFMTPTQFGNVIKYAKPRPATVSLNILYQCFKNIAEAEKEHREMFVSREGTRRYVP